MRKIRMAVLVIIIITIARRYTRVQQRDGADTYQALQQRWEQEDRLLDVEVWGAVPVEP